MESGTHLIIRIVKVSPIDIEGFIIVSPRWHRVEILNFPFDDFTPILT
jgi:hypothetical protein